MATRWKNIIKKTKGFLKGYWKEIVGVVLTGFGLVFFYGMIRFRRYHPTEEALLLGLLGNSLLGLGVFLWLRTGIRWKYRNWIPKDQGFYVEWRKQWKEQHKKLLEAEIAALFLAYCFFSYNMHMCQNGIFYGQYSNYASEYMLFVSVFLQFGVFRNLFHHFMREKLDLFMECMTEINRKNLDHALEIERSSLEKVSRSDQLKVDLITNVSHDLKTPLTSMVGYIELMKKEELSEVVRDYVEVISDKAQRLKEMIESLFSLAKVSSGNIELHMESITLNRLMEQLFADMEDRIKSSGLQFVKQFTKEDTSLLTDNMHLYRICQNLIENALKYSAKGTRVFVKTFVNKENEQNGRENLCLEITNTAGYLMDFDKEDIVERFARGDKARSSEGNGLGLAIVSTYTSALGGEFDIYVDCDQFKAKLCFPR